MITTKDMRDCSLQEIFTHVATHLLEQNERAEEHSGCSSVCKLRVKQVNNKTLACAVGCLIPDDDYHPDMDEDMFADNLELQEYFPNHMHSLLENLQKVHDYSPTDRWRAELEKSAIYFELAMPQL